MTYKWLNVLYVIFFVMHYSTALSELNVFNFFSIQVKNEGESEKSMELVTRVLECLSIEVLPR
jgi:hypothetical protein